MKLTCPHCQGEIELKVKAKIKKEKMPKTEQTDYSLPSPIMFAPSNPNELPYRVKTKIQALICWYKELTGINPTDRAWDKAGQGRESPYAKKLLDYFGGDYATAKKCIQEVGEDLSSKNLPWNLSTVFLKRLPEWEAKRK